MSISFKIEINLQMKFFSRKLALIEIIHYSHTALMSVTAHNYLRFVAIEFDFDMQILTGFVISVF